MAQQRTGYPLDYSRGAAETAKDSLRGMADATTDKVKDAAESTHAMASNVAEEVREYAEEAQTEAVQVFYGEKPEGAAGGNDSGHFLGSLPPGRTLEEIADQWICRLEGRSPAPE